MPGNSSVLALRMNGANNSTTFIDEIGKTITVTGNTVQSNAVAGPYGQATCAYFDGNGDYLSTPSHTDFAFGTGDFTSLVITICLEALYLNLPLLLR